jgi:hypothetical protein
MATRDECDNLPDYKEAVRLLTQERRSREEERRQAEELSAKRKREEREQREREHANKLREQEEHAARAREAVGHWTGGAAFLIPERVSDSKLRAPVACVIEKAKLLLAAEGAEGLLDSLCTSVVDVRVNLTGFPVLVTVVDELYRRLTEIVAGRRRENAITLRFQSIADDANGVINTIASRTYTYGGTDVGLLFSAWEADRQVRRDEEEIDAIRRNVAGHRHSAQVELDRIEQENFARALLARHYLLLLAYAIGGAAHPGELSATEILEIAAGLH